jgi:hypothetical protein
MRDALWVEDVLRDRMICEFLPLSFLCRSFVVPLSFLCRSFVVPLSFLCRSFVVPLSFLCRSFVVPLSFLCRSFVVPLSFLCPSFVLPLSFLCPSFVLPLSFLCPSFTFFPFPSCFLSQHHANTLKGNESEENVIRTRCASPTMYISSTPETTTTTV